MKVVFRADSSVQMGSGHVMRCLTLADELRQGGAEVTFICREHSGNLISVIEDKGYPVEHLHHAGVEYVVKPDDVAHAVWLGVSWEQDAADTIEVLSDTRPQWLIVDNYAIDSRWEELLRPHVGRIMVIDDLADRRHDCDVLLDQNLYKKMESRYDDLVPYHCRNFLGPKYALLRPEFVVARRNMRERNGSIRRILIFFGGSDQNNITAKALESIYLLNRPDILVDVVVSGGVPHREEIRSLCVSMPNTKYHCQVGNMAELMVSADLAFGAGGSTTWERCVLGLPAIVTTLAANQVPIALAIANYGAATYLGNATDLTVGQMSDCLADMICHPSKMKAMSRLGRELLDGSGAADVSSLIISSGDT